MSHQQEVDLKKRKFNEDDNDETQIMIRNEETKKRKMDSSTALVELPPRSSSLSSPILRLEGHQSEVFACKFSKSGQFMASGSYDKTILLWDVFSTSDDDTTTTQNYGHLMGHKNAVLDLDWLVVENRICSASADNSVMLWDSVQCKRLRQFKDHSAIVNSCSASKSTLKGDLFASGSDDRTINIYDQREKSSTKTLKSKFPVFSTCFSENCDRLFSCGVDNVISAYDLRTDKILYNLGTGHTDSITDIKLSPDGNFLLSNGMDNTCRIWDVRHFVEMPNRCVKVFTGAKHAMDKNLTRVSWYKDSSMVATGSENDVIIWSTTTRKILYQLPGHQGSVNCVDFHPQQPIIASASSDKTLYLGEINPKL